MQNNVLVFGNEKLLDEKPLFERGVLDFSLAKTSNFDEFLTLAKNSKNNTLILCANAMIDKLVEEIKTDDDKLSLVDEQAVLIENVSKKTLIVPIEVDFTKFLDKIFESKDVFCCNIFGKGAGFVKDKFLALQQENSLNFVILSQTQFLHTVFYDKFISPDRLKEIFSENVFAFENKTIACQVSKILQEKGIKHSICENGTFGAVASEFYGLQGLVNVQIITDNQELEKFDISSQIISTNGAFSKEVAYSLSKSMAKDFDLALSIVGPSQDGHCFVAVGNSEEIYVFSSSFSGRDVLKNAVNFALFRTLSFLKEKY